MPVRIGVGVTVSIHVVEKSHHGTRAQVGTQCP
ncbi:Uncharacterised protein [Mycobacteroides abscessus subsp. abscessus]|nr:Uncharacterised protein [Mycobacteroides abscessus subsp. abscessus]